MQNGFYKKCLESNADLKSTYCRNIVSNLYSLINRLPEKIAVIFNVDIPNGWNSLILNYRSYAILYLPFSTRNTYYKPFKVPYSS